MIIKVCGMREADNIQALNNIESVDWIGFIFTDKSKRFVFDNKKFNAESTKMKVGVFVNASVADTVEKIKSYDLDLLQLHGDESPDYIKDVKSKIEQNAGGTKRIGFIKAFSVGPNFDFDGTKKYEGHVDYFLFDAKGKDAGGNGIQFDWNVLHEYTGNTPFILAGGIGPNSVNELRNFVHPKWAGIDVNSRFEISPGLKDISAIDVFCKELNTAKAL